MSLSVLIDPFASFWNDTGSAFASTIEVYDAGGAALSTIYTTSAGTIESANPLSLIGGRATIYATDGSLYKVFLKDNNGSVLKILDNMSPSETIRGDLADTASGNGAELVGYISDGTSAVARTVDAKFQEYISVTDFGTTGDGVADDTAEIQAAIDYVESLGGGDLYFPIGTYLISATLTVNKGVRLIAEGWGDDTSNANGTAARTVSIKWDSGTAGSIMISLISATASNYLFGAAVLGLTVNGDNVATYGIKASSTSQCEFDVYVRQVVTAGLQLDDANGVLSNFNRVQLNFTYGSLAAVEGAHGLVLDGEPSDIGCAQNQILNVGGLHKNGDMVRLRDCDNNIFEKVHSSRVSGGTGYTMNYMNGTSRAARNNYVQYAVGNIHFESATYGNRIHHLISEGSSVTKDAGAQYHVDVQDYVDGGLWIAHRFKFLDHRNVHSSSFMVVSGSAAEGVSVLLFGCMEFLDSSNGMIGTILPPFHDWSDGNIVSARLYYSVDTANTSANAVMRLLLGTKGNGQGLATVEEDTDHTVAVNDAANSLKSTTLTLGASVPYTLGDSIQISIQRKPLDASDTASGTLEFHGIELFYEGTGPDSAGSGTYAISPAEK